MDLNGPKSGQTMLSSPVQDRIMDFEEIPAAYRYAETGKKIGSVVIRVPRRHVVKADHEDQLDRLRSTEKPSACPPRRT